MIKEYSWLETAISVGLTVAVTSLITVGIATGLKLFSTNTPAPVNTLTDEQSALGGSSSE